MSLKPIGVVVSGSSPVNVPIHVYKGCENLVKEDAFVVIKDEEKNTEYFGVIRSLRMNDPLLNQNMRSSIIDNPELAKHGKEVVFETMNVRVLGVLKPDGQLEPPRQPPTPRSQVYLVETPGDVNLKLETGLVLGKHKFSGLEIPLKPDALKYHIGIVGATGTGKSRLVVALINEVLEKTDWKVLVFDHSGQDYKDYFENHVVNASSIIQDHEMIYDYLKREISVKDVAEDALYISLLLYILHEGNVEKFISDTDKKGKKPSELSQELNKLPELLENTDIEEKLKNTQWKADKLGKLVAEVLRSISQAKASTMNRLSVSISLQKDFFKSLNERKITARDILEKLNKDKKVVIDLSSVKQEERRYIVYSILRKIWEEIDTKKQPVKILVVIDEAHNYATSKPSVDMIERTAREGRKWGLGLVLASQRFIDFSTDIRNNINTFFFSKLQTPGDLENLEGILDLGGIEYDDIAILATREFYFAGYGNPLKYPVLIEVKEVWPRKNQ